MKTIAEQLNVKEFPFIIMDKNDNQIYIEYEDGYWEKSEYDSNNNRLYFEDSFGVWFKYEYDSRGNKIYFEDSDGNIEDKRVKELTLEQIATKFGVEVSQLKIKK